MRTVLVRLTAGVLLLGAWEMDCNLQDLAQATHCNMVQPGPAGTVIQPMHTGPTSWPISPCDDDPLDHPPLSLATAVTGPSSGSPVAFTVWNTTLDEPRTGPLIWPQGVVQGGQPPAMRIAVDRMPYWANPSPESRPSLIAQLLAALTPAPPHRPVVSPPTLAVYSAQGPW